MHKDYYTNLNISLELSSGEGIDDCNDVKTIIASEMSDCSVHAWFKVFEQVLTMAGFSELVIMQGGAQLAFNEGRQLDAMRKVAELYDLKLEEDIPPADKPGTEGVA